MAFHGTLHSQLRRLRGPWQFSQPVYTQVLQLVRRLDDIESPVPELFRDAARVIVNLQASGGAARLPVETHHAPLRAAAAVVYCAFIEETRRSAHTESELDEHLDAAATALSVAMPIYRLDREPPEVIDRQTLAKGIIAGGARSLRFAGRHPPIAALGIRQADLEVVDKLGSVVTDVRQADSWRMRFFLGV